MNSYKYKKQKQNPWLEMVVILQPESFGERGVYEVRQENREHRLETLNRWFKVPCGGPLRYLDKGMEKKKKKWNLGIKGENRPHESLQISGWEKV